MLGKLVPLFPFLFAGGALFTDRIPDFLFRFARRRFCQFIALKKSL
jgi:hypothetical protein